MKKKRYSTIYRIIHWAIAFSFILLLITIFLRLTWLNKYNIAEIIENHLANLDQHLSKDQLIVLAKEIRKPMWKWHIYIGYILTGLFSLRFMLPLFGQMNFQNPLAKKLSYKMKLQRWNYIIFYVCVTISLVTGLLLEFGSKDFKKPIENIHVLGIYYLVVFIIIHLIGVFLAEFTNQKGIVSRIISGSKKI